MLLNSWLPDLSLSTSSTGHCRRLLPVFWSNRTALGMVCKHTSRPSSLHAKGDLWTANGHVASRKHKEKHQSQTHIAWSNMLAPQAGMAEPQDDFTWEGPPT
ncbi:hypothetical protein GW17_00039731 [Ensete ventricosum]|nr:hypothetical protein GW17_00039731 [Ensete ventricosum]